MRLMHFLRYNSRHHLWFPRGCHYGEGRFVVLNPIRSSSHNERHQRTWSWYEPLWVFRLRQRLFCVVGRQRCGRRDGMFARNRNDGALLDTWNKGPDGYRTCSHCGSIHPDDLMDVCRKSLTDERYDVHMSDKRYKAYLRIPGVRNASEGAIKFYMQHAPESPSKEDQELFKQALNVSRERFNARMTADREKMTGKATA
jgi:hypothetical protein